MFERCLKITLLKSESKGLEFCLKEQQKKAVRQLYERKDLVSVLPTGFGKSLVFQLLERNNEQIQAACEQHY